MCKFKIKRNCIILFPGDKERKMSKAQEKLLKLSHGGEGGPGGDSTPVSYQSLFMVFTPFPVRVQVPVH
jgi:hypothetical protein